MDKLRKVFRELPIDSAGFVSKGALLRLGQGSEEVETRTTLGRLRTEPDGRVSEDAFVDLFEAELPKDEEAFQRNVEHFVAAIRSQMDRIQQEAPLAAPVVASPKKCSRAAPVVASPKSPKRDVAMGVSPHEHNAAQEQVRRLRKQVADANTQHQIDCHTKDELIRSLQDELQQQKMRTTQVQGELARLKQDVEEQDQAIKNGRSMTKVTESVAKKATEDAHHLSRENSLLQLELKQARCEALESWKLVGTMEEDTTLMKQELAVLQSQLQQLMSTTLDHRQFDRLISFATDL